MLQSSRLKRRNLFLKKTKEMQSYSFKPKLENLNKTEFELKRNSITTINNSEQRSQTMSMPTCFRIGQDYFKEQNQTFVLFVKLILRDLNLDLSRSDARFAMKLTSLLNEIVAGYENNAYHNIVHGFSVFHLASIVLTLNPRLVRGDDSLSQEYILAFLIACLSHDIGHRGYSNNAEKQFVSKIADYFSSDVSDEEKKDSDFEKPKSNSVLEKFHAAKTIEVLKKDENNIYAFLSESEQSKIHEFISKIILSTDMELHGLHVENLKDISNLDDFLKNERNLQSLFNSIIHCCDIGAQCFDLEVAIRWERRVAKEFRNEAELLTDSNFDVSSFLKTYEVNHSKLRLECLFSKKSKSIKQKFKEKYYRMPSKKQCANQIYFIENYVEPLWQELVKLFPNLRHFYLNLNKNKKFYRFVRDEKMKEATAHFQRCVNQNFLKKKVFRKEIFEKKNILREV